MVLDPGRGVDVEAQRVPKVLVGWRAAVVWFARAFALRWHRTPQLLCREPLTPCAVYHSLGMQGRGRRRDMEREAVPAPAGRDAAAEREEDAMVRCWLRMLPRTPGAARSTGTGCRGSARSC